MGRDHRALGPGHAYQCGATVRGEGVEFVLFSRHATAVTLLLYDPDGDEPVEEIPLDPVLHRRGDLWSIFVAGLGSGQLYAYRADGPGPGKAGHHFDPQRVLMDPYARALSTNIRRKGRPWSATRGANALQPRSLVVGSGFDWQGTGWPNRPLADSVIYEVHLRGLSADPSAGVANPGTYLGLIEKIPYFLDLGVTAIELLPIHEFDLHEVRRKNPLTGHLLTNYWGYSTLGFFAPNGRDTAGGEPGDPATEFKTMVRELHRAGLEVILDVVYNHTGEGNERGPIVHMKGLDNSIYYHLTGDGLGYKDFSGCGNSLNANHPVVRRLILDSLRYWVTEMGVDGFRFDLASVLSRDPSGQLLARAPVLEEIDEDPVLRDTKIIAEAWDAAGAYQVGGLFGRWAEWNGRFRDDVRRFWRGDPGMSGALATRLTGSSDLYQPSGRRPFHSINFVTSHDGFTLADLVSYNEKHNPANGEDNRDGDNNNFSYNFGVEGPSDRLKVDRLRTRQIKNFLATLLFSQGVPMILGGDEFRRTQQGNNNAYCQDNEISWIDWRLRDMYAEIFRFCQGLIRFRHEHPVLRRRAFFGGHPIPGHRVPDIAWFGALGQPKDWHQDDQTLVALIAGLPAEGTSELADDDLLLLFNASHQKAAIQLPAAPTSDQPWLRLLDTALAPPHDLTPGLDAEHIPPGTTYPLAEHSMVCLRRPRT